MPQAKSKLSNDALLVKALKHVSNGVVITDLRQKDNPIIYVNDAFTKITGYSREEVLGKNCRFLQGKDTDEEELNKVRYALRNKTKVFAVLKNYRKDKVHFWNELYISPIRDASGAARYFVGIQNDITERIKAQEELQNYKRYLEKLVDERTKELTNSNRELRDEIEQRRKAQEKISSLYKEISTSARRLQIKLANVEKSRVNLTANEKQGLLLLVDNGAINMSKISKRSGIPSSTLNTQKNRFQEEGYINRCVFPRLDALGFEIITTIIYEGPEKEIPKDGHKATHIFLERHSNFFYVRHSERGGIIFCITENWASFKHLQENLERATIISSSNFRHYRIVHFPIARSRLVNYFNYAGVIQNFFGTSQPVNSGIEKRIARRKLRINEKKVLIGLVQYPDYTLNKLSTRLELSKPTISKIRESLTHNGYVKPVFKPNLGKIGGQLLLLSHYSFNTNNSLDINFKPSNEFLSVLTTTDYFSLSAFSGYQSLQDHIDKCVVCAEREIKDDPLHIILPMNSVSYKKNDFSSILKKI